MILNKNTKTNLLPSSMKKVDILIRKTRWFEIILQ